MRALLIVLGLTVSAATADYIVGWEPSPSAGDPVHEPIVYRVYKAEGGATNFWHVDGTSVQFRQPTSGPVRIWITTLNGAHVESGPSEVLTYEPGGQPNPPVNLRMTR